jgi:GT2 family glycosyltransferase
VLRGTRLFDPNLLAAGGATRSRRWRDDRCFMLISRDLWEELYGLDESLLMYGEETDLCIRARVMDSRCIGFQEARLLHYGGASERVPGWECSG